MVKNKGGRPRRLPADEKLVKTAISISERSLLRAKEIAWREKTSVSQVIERALLNSPMPPLESDFEDSRLRHPSSSGVR